MSPENWQKLKLILEQALEIAPESRRDFLDKIPEQDLRLEVESLLRFEANDALEQNAFSIVTENANSFIGKQIGKYQIISELGTGGMGAVFLAERADGEFSQTVALKLIKNGIGSASSLRRFVNERQILASLEHPRIARLIDGGTTDENLPFFVMEYVKGDIITEFARKKNLSLEKRLELFREVCAGVTYAHQNLVIHRDLKPSNILVNEQEEPKLLDFGIAKLLKTETSGETATQHFVFTPEYASPEQIRGENLSTATDVYSLGVILYELLTDTRPFRFEGKNFAQIIELITQTEPPAPSAISNFKSKNSNAGNGKITDQNRKPKTENQQNHKSKIANNKFIKGDLDNIILKALKKEPERRYSSVEQFSEDIRRYLADLPVTAQSDTWRYRAEKFISRNRVAVAAAALIALALIGGIIGTTWQSVRAERERARAERRFENLRKISNSLVNEIERTIRDLPGSLPARQILLTRATEQLDALAADSDGNTELQLELVWAYQNLGWMPDGKLIDRRKTFEKAVALTERILAAEPDNFKARDRLAMLYLDLIIVSRLRGDVEYTLEYNRRAVEIIEKIRREANDLPEYRDSVWTVYYHYALTLQQLGKAEESVKTARKILPLAEEMYNSSEAKGYDFMKPHLTRLQIGYGLSYAGDYQSAIKEFETALAECQAEFVKRPENHILRRNEANIRLQIAAALEFSGDATAALKQAQTALEIREKMSANNPTDFDYQIAVADAELIFGQMLVRQNQTQTVEARFRRALETYQKIAEIDADRLQVKILAARAQTSLGNALVLKGNFSEGLGHLREAVGFYKSIGAATTIDAGLKRNYAESLAQFAAPLAKKSESLNEARENYRQSLELWNELKNQGVLRNSDASQTEEISRKLSELSGK